MLIFSSEIRSVMLQIGAFLEPILPSHPTEASVIFEPVTKTRERLHAICREREARGARATGGTGVAGARLCDRVIILGAAVSSESGVAGINFFNYGGVASSLSKPTAKVSRTRFGTSTRRAEVKPWNRKKADHMKNETRAFEFVPVLSLSAVIDSIPHHLSIPLLALDMQGHDLAAAAAAPSPSSRV